MHGVVVMREIERAEVPLRILEDDVLEQVAADRERLRAAGGTAPVQFAARLETGKDQFACFGILHARVNLARGFDLRRGQAIRRVRKDPASTTLKDARIEVAVERFTDQTVLQAILRVARVERGAMNHWILARRDHARRVVERRLRVHQHLHALIHAVVAGCAGENRVEVGGESLRFLERHASAAGAAIEVRQPRGHAVEIGDGRFPLDGGFMNGPVAEVLQPLGMPHREAGVGARVTRIR